MERRFTFDGVAALYDEIRPDYPNAVFDDVVAIANLELRDSILEIGCGTGRATRSFLSRGFRVVAIEPGSELIRVARKNLEDFQKVELIESTFEAWPPEVSAFRLLVAA
jgi:16S rRNA A1518/A1519 N6-dimethyltransferase RsmA/KsgA/DIM1 with predicted DNA glycosylase/AP lyase activity